MSLSELININKLKLFAFKRFLIRNSGHSNAPGHITEHAFKVLTSCFRLLFSHYSICTVICHLNMIFTGEVERHIGINSCHEHLKVLSCRVLLIDSAQVLWLFCQAIHSSELNLKQIIPLRVFFHLLFYPLIKLTSVLCQLISGKVLWLWNRRKIKAFKHLWSLFINHLLPDLLILFLALSALFILLFHISNLLFGKFDPADILFGFFCFFSL